jgi:hypothetical protein
MRITFERTGGFMGRKVSLILELDELPSDQAGTLSRLLDEANFFAIEETPSTPGPTRVARDDFHYLITVETRDVTHTVRTTNATMPASLRPLIEELSQLARMPRGN